MVFGLAVFALSAVAIAAFMLTSARSDPALAAGAIFLLAAGQLALILTTAVRAARADDHAEALDDGLQQLLAQSEQAEARLAEVERVARDTPRGMFDTMLADIKALHASVRALMESRRDELRAADPRWNAEPAAPAPAAPPPPQSSPAEAQRLDLLLEPVIELATGATAHYRAMLDLSDGNGQVVQHAELMEKADAGGMRAALDVHMLKQVVPVLRRLRARNPALRAFVPVGAATLQSPDDLGRVAALLEHVADVARGIAFEITHRDLGQLDEAGIEGLARLARAGTTLALSEVLVAGLDLAALRQLGVRFLSFPPSAADAGFGPTPAWREFVQYARAMQFQIIIADVQSSQQADAAARIGRYAHGPFYAPPRKVRADAGMSAVLQRSAAA